MSSNTEQQKFKHEQIQYIEFLSSNLEKAKAFYTKAFRWAFTDYGPEYSSFEGDFVDGGFTLGEPSKGSILVVIYSQDLEETRTNVLNAGGVISKEIFAFPGGRRFQFLDPDGYELAVWSL